MKKPTAPKKATPATTATKTGPSGMMISGKSTGTANPTSSSALGKMPVAGTLKKAEAPATTKQAQQEVKAPK